MKAIGFQAGQVGDLVMATVAAKQFKLDNPDTKLTFAIGSKYGHVKDLFAGLSYIDNIHVWDTYDGWPAKSDLEYVRNGGFDTVFNPFPRHSRPDWYNHYHYVEETCLMAGLGKPLDLQCELGYKPKKLFGFEKIITTSLFASGNQPYKTLDSCQMAGLVAGLNKLGYQVVQIGSTDKPIPNAITLEWLGYKTDIYTAIDAICSAKVHITIDTAFSWISSAYKRPLVGLYAVNYADMPVHRVVSHNPVNPNAIYINDPVKVDNIDIDRIIEDVKKHL